MTTHGILRECRQHLKTVATSAVTVVLLLACPVAHALTLNVVDDAGTPIKDFRWILQEDISHPGIPYVQTNDTVSIVTHTSDARVLATGHATNSTWTIRLPKYTAPKLVPDGTVIAGVTPTNYPYNNPAYDTDPSTTNKYVIEVMASGYSVGGQLVARGQTNLTVRMNRNPLPTTQISILVFHDHLPLNNEPDAEEEGIPGCRVSMYDNLGGPFIQDAFANPVGTEYATNSDGSYQVDAGGFPTNITKLGDGYLYTDKDGKALIKNMWNDKFSIEVIPPTGENWNGGHATMKSGGYKWQTSTIEGTPFVDSWAIANGARVFIEGWGAGFYHVFFGFCDPDQLPGAAPASTNVAGVTVHGKLVVNHYGRPPQTALLAEGPPVLDGWIGLNIADVAVEGSVPVEGVDRALLPATTCVWAQPCDPETGEFVITNVAPGAYQLVSWDRPLDFIFNAVDLIVPPTNSVLVTNGVYEVGNIKVVRWFGSMQGSVFYDANGNGFPDSNPPEEYIPSVPVNLRFRDGSMYQRTKTKVDGTYSFTEIFPFFKWLVAEVSNGRWKSSGMTAVVDDGGTLPTPNGWAMPSSDINDPELAVRNPQVQYNILPDGTVLTNSPIINPNTGNALSRTQLSTNPSEPLLTQAIQVYNGQYDRIDWGKMSYGSGQGGGISGIISYNNTRAEADPRYSVQELWDPGIARVQVTLYQYATNYAALAASNSVGKQTVYGMPYDIYQWMIKIQRPGATNPRLADVDNYPFGWATGGTRGPEDVDRDDPAHLLPDAGRVFNPGDAIQITHSDSWDDDVAANMDPAHLSAGGWPAGTIQVRPSIIQGRKVVGSDNFSTWEQIRPGVFDGAYVLNSYHPGGMANNPNEVPYLPPGDYIVQASPPRGYVIETEESRNIVFGDAYTPAQLDIPPECVGDFHLVPPFLDLFPDQQMPADFANQWRPLADRKLVTVVEKRNAPCVFSMYSEVPKAGHVVGFVLNDLSAEFDPNNPSFGEREGAPWLPISFRDWAGHEVARTYSDEFGCYDAMVPSTYNAAVPCPSGYAPTMLTVILNDPSMPADPANPDGLRIPDPYYNPGFTIAPVVLEYWPGKVNYADTPIVPIGAFVGGPNGQLDVEPPSGTPVIKSVTGRSVGGNAGPYVGSKGSTGDVITITSLGLTQVLNPDYTLHGTNPLTKVIRDFGFGATAGAVILTPTDRSSTGTAVTVNSWNDSNITFRLPNVLPPGTPTPSGGTEWQLMVTRANGKTTPVGITLSYETDASRVHMALPVDPASLQEGQLSTTIQDQIDAAQNGDLVIVPASPWQWNEYMVMYKPIRLQGSGVGTIINGVPDPQNRVPAWHNKIIATLGDDPFVINECPCVEVFGETNSLRTFPRGANPGDTMFSTGFDKMPSRIDGFLFKGAIHGGAINAFDKCSNLRISNNRITGNMGDTFNGGISLGAPAGGGIEGGNEDPGSATDYENTNVVMEFNQILKNSSLDGAGGIAIHTGGAGYKIRNNYIMGNFCFDAPGAAFLLSGAGNGGGAILHMGLSPGGLIADNVIAFNEVYFGFSTGGGDGGGICIQGEADGASPTGSSGAGSVTIINNLIMGNLAAAGLGGGIRLAGVNGPEMLDTNNLPVFEVNEPGGLADNPPGLFPDDFIGTPSPDPTNWYEINIFNNIIVNNAAGFSGGGISIQDSIKVNIIGNTIANNDSAAVALNTFPPDLGVSVGGGAGIVSHPHTMAISSNTPAPYNFPFSKPVLKNNIIWHNRSFHFDYSLVGRALNDPTNHIPIADSGGLVFDGYRDLDVVGGIGNMTPSNCILSGSGTPPNFVNPYANSNRTGVVYDEGGHNSISLRFDEIGLYTPDGAVRGDYHLQAPLPTGANINAIPGLAVDYDGQARPTAPDIGADQYAGVPAGVFLPGNANFNLPVAIVGVLPNPGTAPYAPTPTTGPGELPHAAEGEPVAEANPLIPPGPEVPPPPLNPVWMTANPGSNTVPLFVRGDFLSLQSFLLRLQAQGDTNSMTLGAKMDPVAKYVFDHLSGNWPPAPPADGEEPAAPEISTKSFLALWNGGWVKYNQPPYYEPMDEDMLAMVINDMNNNILGALSGNPLGISNNVLTAYGAVNGRPGYTPSTRSTQLFGSPPLTPTVLSPIATRRLAVQLLNRSVIQDGFMDIRRWYDPNVAFTHLVCGDGMAEMADGTELYTFGFDDQTATDNNPGNSPDLGPDKIFAYALAHADTPAPTIAVKQDQEFHLDLSNVGFAFRPDLFDPHTIHFHGFPQAAPIFDGMPLASVAVLEGATVPYFYKLQIEGTYFYHCHVEATEHMQQGMIGNLWVESRQSFTGNPVKGNTNVVVAIGRLGGNTNAAAPLGYAYNDGDGSTRFDVEYPILITGFDHYFHDQEMAIQPSAFATLFDTYPLLNGRGYPDTVNTNTLINSLGFDSQAVNTLITARQGQRILLRLANVSETDFYTVTVLGIPMTVVGKDARLLRGPDGKNLYYNTTSVTTGGGETMDLILDTANTQPGTYFLYSARLTQLSNDQEDYGGLMTHIVITP
jgi:large repetitive protein